MKKLILILLLFPLMMYAQEFTIVGDVDCSGDVNSEDASLILQFVTNIIDELPCQENMTGLNPEQLQEIINLMDEQLNINYANSVSDNYPNMISNISNNVMNWPDAINYCNDLEEFGFNDWFLPNLDQLSYAISGGCQLPDERTSNGLWTRSPSHTNETQMYRLNESDSGLDDGSWNSSEHCRCVRFNGSETNLSNNNNSSQEVNSFINGNMEQTINMIGPMYLYEEYPDFLHSNNGQMGEFYLRWADANRFCRQLIYNGYNDWRLPSFYALINYYAEFNSIEIPNKNAEVDALGTIYFWTSTNAGNVATDYTLINITSSDYNLDTQYSGQSENVSLPNIVMYGTYAQMNSGYPCFCVR